MTNSQCRIPRGKVMGGSSVLNYMIFTRGHRKDYDQWAQNGNEGETNENKKKILLFFVFSFRKLILFVVSQLSQLLNNHNYLS